MLSNLYYRWLAWMRRRLKNTYVEPDISQTLEISALQGPVSVASCPHCDWTADAEQHPLALITLALRHERTYAGTEGHPEETSKLIRFTP